MFKKFQSLRVPILVLAFLILAEGISTRQLKSKRQIYREQVLPSRGGKIPDGAFRTDRLALNRLNKEGISVPDGVLLEHRLVHSHPHINKHDPEDEAAIIRIIQKDDNRFVAAPGKFHHETPLTVPSTYIIRKPIGSVLKVPAQHGSSQLFGRLFPNKPGFNQFAQNGYRYQQQQQYPPEIPHHFPQIPRKYSHPGYNPNKYKTVEIPNKKYLPSVTSPNKYYPTEYLAPPRKYVTQGYNPTIIHHPHPQGYDPPVSYQSVSYFPATTPLMLPNREIQNTRYHQVKDKGHVRDSSNTYSDDIHDAIDWPALLAHYTQVSNNLDALNRETSDKLTPHRQLLAPEVLGSVDSHSGYYSESIGRYTRKSKQVAESANETENGVLLIKIKCGETGGPSQNTVGHSSTQCPI